MIIPDPEFVVVPYDLNGMSMWQGFCHIVKNSPALRLTKEWLITLDDGQELVFPVGFVTDGASVPRLLWLVPGFSPFGPLIAGAIPHDFGYQHGYLLMRYNRETAFKLNNLPFGWDREKYGDYVPVYVGYKQEFFDNLFRGLIVEKTGAKKVAAIAWKALRMFGHKAWNKYRKNGPGAYGNNSLNLPGVMDG